jgi:hypothetical protein
LPEANIDRAKAFAHRGGAGAFEGDAMFANEIERAFGQRVAVRGDGVQAGWAIDPADGHFGGGDHRARRRRHFRPNAIAGNQHNVHPPPLRSAFVIPC